MNKKELISFTNEAIINMTKEYDDLIIALSHEMEEELKSRNISVASKDIERLLREVIYLKAGYGVEE